MRAPLLLTSLCLAPALAPVGVAAQDDGLTEAQLVLSVSSVGEGLASGATRRGDMRTGRLRQGQSRTFTLDLEASQCVAVVAAGEAGIQNIDVSLSRGRTELARDATTGANASARFCATERMRGVRVAVGAFRGAGQYAAAVYDLPAGAAAAATADGETPLERLASRIEAVGGTMTPVTPPQRETLAEGERLERQVALQPGRCYRVVVGAADSVLDLDLALSPERGAPLQTDASDDGMPTLGVLAPLCPARPGAHRLQLFMERGAGAFAWRVLGSSQRGASTGEAAATRHRIGGAGDGFLPGRIRARHQAAGEGRPPVTDLLSGRLSTSEARDVEVPVEGGRCYVALAAGVPSVRELDLRVLDNFGNERARDETRDAFPSVRFCPSISGRWQVQVRMYNGYGAYALQIFGR